MKRYLMFIVIICVMILSFCGSMAAAEIQDNNNINLTVSNANGVRSDTDVNGDNTYSYFKGSDTNTGGLNSIKISDVTNDTSAKVISTSSQSGTFYIKNTGGKGYSDNGVLMLAVNGTIPDNFQVNIKASGYQWTPSLTGGPANDAIKYNATALDETFYKSDFIYGPQTWKPYYQPNYPIYENQDTSNTSNNFYIMFIDLYAGILNPANYPGLTNNGTLKIQYSFQNLPLGSLAAFNAYTYVLVPETGQTTGGIAWTNRVNTPSTTYPETSGYQVYGVTNSPIADFSASPTEGTVPLTVKFTDKSTGTKPFSYEWDFGDGSGYSTEQNPTHTYNNPGTYTVKLNITNGAGTSEKTMIITTSINDILAPIPSANLPNGLYNTSKTVYLTATDDSDTNPKIYYILNDIVNSPNILYTGPITINSEGTTILRFFAIDAAGNPSDIVNMAYIIDKTAPTVAVNPIGGNYSVVKNVTLTATDTNPTKIYYTTDGSNPRSSSAKFLYNGPITIYKTTNILYAAIDAAGNWSPVYNAKYIMNDNKAPVASADLSSGSYTADQIVKLSAIDELDPKPKIYYTLNGTTPTTSSTLYNWPISINLVGTTILKFIAVDSAGHISSVITRIYSLDKPGVSGTWNSTIRDTNSMYNSIAIDSAGYPHIAYYQLQSANTNPMLKCTYKDKNGWHTENIESTLSGSGYYVSLALDSLGMPHIAYGQLSPDKLKYAFKNASGWHFLDLVNVDVSYINLVLYNDQPSISYYDNAEERVKYIYYNGTGWSTEYVTPGATYGHWNSLSLNLDGNPRISYYDYNVSKLSGVLMYAKKSPIGLWQYETVDNSGDAGLWNSLAIDSSNIPKISYIGNNGVLKYAYRNESAWITETVDSLKSSTCKLILDKLGNPRIVYRDFNTNSFKYAYKEGLNWVISNIDTIDGVGECISIAMSPSGIPHVSYMSTNLKLKYAYLLPFTVSANPQGGVYNSAKTVNLTSTSGTTIYYTTDKSDPRTSSTKIKYGSPIVINTTKTLKFAAVDAANNWSYIRTETYTILTFIQKIDPANNALNVAIDKAIEIIFNEPIKAGNMWIELKASNGTTVKIYRIISGNALTIKPATLLTQKTKYTLILHTGCVTNLAGDPFAYASKSFNTTIDGIVPTIKLADPANGATSVARNKQIKITFSEPIKAGNMWIELKASNGTTVKIYRIISGNALTIKPATYLAPNTKYTLILHSGSIKDLAGNPLAYYSRTFTTGSV